MRRFKFAAMLCGAFAVLAFPALAAELKATIPFDFHMGNAVLPAGDYSIQVQAANGVVLLRNVEGKPAAMSSSLPSERSRKETAGVLQFNKIGEEYFLNALWAPGAQAGVKLPASKHEKEALARAEATVIARVTARTK